jgi:ankyrin repeat protein
MQSYTKNIIVNIHDVEYIKKVTEILDVNCVIFKGGFTLLHMAIISGRYYTIKYLLEIGGDPNKENDYGETSLSLSIKKNNNMNINHLLIKYNGDVLKCMKIMLRSIYDINNTIFNNSNNYTLLHLAVIIDHYESVKFLLENGADPNIQDIYGRTPASISVHSEESGIICILVMYGGNHESYIQ